jgi:phage/plasmid-associated DNA primase
VDHGVFNFTTKTLLPFSRDIVLISKLSHDYPTAGTARRSVEELVIEVRKRVVDDVWGLDNRYFVFQSSSRSYANEVEDKRYLFVVGDGNNGKVVWVGINKSAFEGYTGNLCFKNMMNPKAIPKTPPRRYRGWWPK